MAQRRMFNKTITNNDNFLEMPDSSQNLYFHLSMNADDDGFVDNWKSIIRMTGHKEDDLKILIAKQYIIPFESGVIVIRHWRLNNYLQKDRITPTNYKEEKALLTTDMNNVYNLDTKCIHSIDKNSIDKNSIDKSINKYFEDDTLNNSVKEWFEYKKQRKDKFTEMGKKKLITQIKNNIDKYGVKAVVNLIDECMANNYQGIIFDKLGKPEAKPRYQIESIDERNRRLGI